MQKTSDSVDILIVDDREDNLLALEALLGSTDGYNLVKALSGREALRLISTRDFAMVLLDVQMPEIDGFQTAEIIRQNPDYRKIPILFVTAINKDERYVYRGYETGAVDYIFKPFDPVILKSKVAVFADLYLQRKHIERQAAQLRDQENIAYRNNLQELELRNLRKYQTLANAIPHMVWEADADGSLVYHNDQCEMYTGMTLEECVGMGWQKAIHPGDIKDFLVTWLRHIQLKEKFAIEARIRNKEGRYRYHLVKVVPKLSEDGRMVGWIGTCTDIQIAKDTERDLVESRKVAENANAAKTQFLANMSHEIRTPMNAIIGFTELMLEPDIPEEERQNSLSIVRRNSRQLLKIIDEILDISKVEAGGLELEMVETQIVYLVLGIRSLLQVNAAKKGVKLKFSIDGEVPEQIVTDSTRLRQILMNLIGNAIKFTNSGEVELRAKVLKRHDGKSCIRFAIRDTGVGISEDVAEKIFVPFLQGDSSTTRVYGGTGLGLALSRKLARALGGDIWLEQSEPGTGSTFVAEIGLEIVEGSNWISTFLDVGEVDGKFEIDEKERPLNGARILLAEDAEDNQLLISHFLNSLGAVIDVANNGQEAIEKALSNDYAAVLMDIQMPLVDGYEATSRLRQAGFRKPIIALTAHALPEERERSLRTGCTAHLTKPLDRRQLVESLVEHVERGL